MLWPSTRFVIERATAAIGPRFLIQECRCNIVVYLVDAFFCPSLSFPQHLYAVREATGYLFLSLALSFSGGSWRIPRKSNKAERYRALNFSSVEAFSRVR